MLRTRIWAWKEESDRRMAKTT